MHLPKILGDSNEARLPLRSRMSRERSTPIHMSPLWTKGSENFSPQKFVFFRINHKRLYIEKEHLFGSEHSIHTLHPGASVRAELVGLLHYPTMRTNG